MSRGAGLGAWTGICTASRPRRTVRRRVNLNFCFIIVLVCSGDFQGSGLGRLMGDPQLLGLGGALGELVPRGFRTQAAIADIVESRRIGVGAGLFGAG